MAEKFKPLPPTLLAEQGRCCGRGCLNCPFLPRHQRSTQVDEEWLKFFETNGEEVTYEVYLAYLAKEK